MLLGGDARFAGLFSMKNLIYNIVRLLLKVKVKIQRSGLGSLGSCMYISKTCTAVDCQKQKPLHPFLQNIVVSRLMH